MGQTLSCSPGLQAPAVKLISTRWKWWAVWALVSYAFCPVPIVAWIEVDQSTQTP